MHTYNMDKGIKNSVLAVLLCLVFAAPRVHAQAERSGMERFIQLSRTDAGYKKFQSGLKAIATSAMSRNEKIAAARIHFERNSGLLNGLYRKAGMAEPGGIRPAGQKVHTPQYLIKNSGLIGTHAKPIGNTLFSKTRGFDFSWQQRHFPNGNMPTPFDTSGSSKLTGRQVITSTDICTSAAYCYLGIFRRGFGEYITVPSDPEIMAARVTFEYSFEYDAWDSHNGKSAVELLLYTDKGFKSDDLNDLPIALSYAPPYERWKKAATLMPLDSISGNFGEYHASASSSFSIEGYVTPGANLEFRLGFGFPAGTIRGTNGNYHYAEFYLKKMTVTYFKSLQ